MKPLTYCPPLSTALMASALTVATALPALAADKPTLTVYTYDSFITEWGPGPEIKSGFEATCACTVEFIAPGDATETFNRLRLEGKNSEADVLVGLDSNLVAAADKSSLFEPTSIDTSAISLPIDWDASTYVPFDWGYFAFVYDADKLTEVPTSLEALADAPRGSQHPYRGPALLHTGPWAPALGQASLWRPRARDLAGAPAPYCHRHQRLVGGLWHVP